MTKKTWPVSGLMFAAMVGLAGLGGISLGRCARSEVLLYEGFNYASPGVPVALSDQGATNTLGMTGTWTAFRTGTAAIKVYQQGETPGVNFSNGVANAYNGTMVNLPTSGGYFGMGGTNATDHMIVSRPLDPAVTAKFIDGSSTWFSFVSVRGYDLNPAGMRLAIGNGPLKEDRGLLSTGEAIGGGGGVGSSVKNGYKIYPQFWDNTTASPGETVGTFTNYDILGSETSTGNAVPSIYSPYSDYPLPLGQTAGLDSMLLNNTSGVQANGARNIVVGKIEWHTGSPDVVSVGVFWDTAPLTESAFNAMITAQPTLSSANWGVGVTKPDLDQSLFNTISLSAGKWFGDEVRLATTFDEVVGQSIVVPEPSSLLLCVASGLAILLMRYKRLG